MEKLQKLEIATFVDDRGTLSALELKDFIDWKVERIYYLTDVKKARGGHAVRHEKKIYICVKGCVKAKFHDGKQWIEYELKGPNDAVYMKEMCFRDFYYFSDNAVLLAVSSVNYKPDDYIYDLGQFISEVNS